MLYILYKIMFGMLRNGYSAVLKIIYNKYIYVRTSIISCTLNKSSLIHLQFLFSVPAKDDVGNHQVHHNCYGTR